MSLDQQPDLLDDAPMSLVELLHKEYPEATMAECRRFARACNNEKKDEDVIKDDAEKMLEGA